MYPVQASEFTSGWGSGSGLVGATDTTIHEIAQVAYLLSEGPVSGLVDGLKSIYFNDVPWQNADGSFNFKGVSFAAVRGTNTQAVIPGFTDVETDISVGSEVRNDTPQTISVSDSGLDAVRIKIGFNSMQKVNTDGSTSSVAVQLKISVSTDGGSYVPYAIPGGGFVNGRTPSPVVVSWRIELPPGSSWNIKVERLTADTVDPYRQDKSYLQSYTKLFDLRMRYPNSTVFCVAFDARAFGSIPRVSFDVNLRQIQVPTNYDPIARTYATTGTGTSGGTWDGTFKTAWSNNPAWCLYDMATNTRYGAGAYMVGTDLDRFGLYGFGQYCDGFVATGVPKRATISLSGLTLTATTAGTYTRSSGSWITDGLIVGDEVTFGGFTNAANNGRGTISALTATVLTVTDKTLVSEGPVGSCMVATQAPTEPRFTCNLYLAGQEDAIKVLANMASVFNAQAYWAAGNVKWVEDVDASPVAQFSPSNVIGGQFSYQGSSKQARHTAAIVTWNDPAKNYQAVPHYEADEVAIARYGLNIAQAVALGCTSEGQATRFARWLLATEKLQTDTVTFQTALEGLATSPGDIILVQDPSRTTARLGGRVISGTMTSIVLDAPVTLTASVSYTVYITMPDGSVATRVLTNAAGTTDVLTWASGLSEAPNAMSQWGLWATADTPSRWRTLGIRSLDKLNCEITALYHDPAKYALIESGFTLASSSSSTLQFAPPVGLSVSESIWVQTTDTVNDLLATWTAPSVTVQPVRYEASCSLDYAPWQPMNVLGTQARFSPVQPGNYRVRVAAVYGPSPLASHYSPFVEASLVLTGKTTPPSDVTGFRISRSAGKMLATWDGIPDVDLNYYEMRTGPSWETGVSLITTVATSVTLDRYQGGNYWLKAWDTSGNASANAALVIISADTIANVVVTADDSLTGFTGTKTNFATDSFGLISVSGSSPSIYDTLVVDLGAIIPCRVEFTPDIRQAPQGVTWSSWTAAWSTYTDPWQGIAGTISATYQMRSSNDNVTWTNWATYAPGTYTARYFQFRVTCSTTDTSILPRIYALPVTLDVPDRVVKIPGLAIGSGGTSYTFSTAYVSLQTVQVTVLNGATGDSVKVTGKTNAGFTVNLYDSTGSPKAGTVDITTFGYGEAS